MAGESAARMHERLVREARGLFRVRYAVLLGVAELEGRVEVAAMDPEGTLPDELLGLSTLPPVTEAVEARTPVTLIGESAGETARTLGVVPDTEVSSMLLLPLVTRGEVRHVLLLGNEGRSPFLAQDIEVASAFAVAATAGLDHLQMALQGTASTTRELALARAAKTLNESLDLNRVLVRICEEAATILDADIAAVYIGDGDAGVSIQAACGLPPDVIGEHLAPGEGLAGRVAQGGESLLTNDYRSMMPSSPEFFSTFRSALAVPMHWEGRLRGVLSLGYTRAHLVTRSQLSLLEAFAELAAAACRNASVHAGVAHAARTDALTGCLNHAALHDTLRRELERCRRTNTQLSLAMVDLDDFKQVNEQHGHLAGDQVLRAVGHGLRQGVRSYDHVGRYGGDEFAVLAVDAGEKGAAEVAERALASVLSAVEERDLPAGSGRATAGVAEWDPQEDATSLIERADQALLYAKQKGRRGEALRASAIPEGFLPSAAQLAARPRLVRRRDALRKP